jgi:hypothetical protein
LQAPAHLGPARPRNWAGIVIPLVLGAALLADGLSRFFPIDGLAIRAWEVVNRNAFTEGGIPFEPNRHYVNQRAYGDLAAALNHPNLRQYRREEFTTDAWGYRNLPSSNASAPPDVILVGSSFSVSSGVSDSDTLAAQVARMTGKRVYNAAGGPPSPTRVLEVAKRLGMRQGLVIVEFYESNGFPERPSPPARLHQECVARLGPSCLALKGWLRVSPLEILLQRAYRVLEEDDRWLPNASDPFEPPPRLRDGTPMLFSERAPVFCPGIDEEAALGYFRWFRDALPGFRILVVLVPLKYSVYGDLTDLPPPPPAAGPADPPSGAPGATLCRQRIAHAADAVGLPVIDLTEPLRRAARQEFPRHSYVYFLDDTHWNRDGIEVAAGIIASHPVVRSSD